MEGKEKGKGWETGRVGKVGRGGGGGGCGKARGDRTKEGEGWGRGEGRNYRAFFSSALSFTEPN